MESKTQKFKFNFNANNVFKYDSSDDENTHKIPETNNQMVDEAKDMQQNSHKDTLFLDNNDVRFKGMCIKNPGIKVLFM